MNLVVDNLSELYNCSTIIIEATSQEWTDYGPYGQNLIGLGPGVLANGTPQHRRHLFLDSLVFSTGLNFHVLLIDEISLTQPANVLLR